MLIGLPGRFAFLTLAVVALAAGGCGGNPGSDSQKAVDPIATAVPTPNVLLGSLDTPGGTARRLRRLLGTAGEPVRSKQKP